MAQIHAGRPWLRFALYGLGSAACYGWLFANLNDRAVIGQFTRTDGWYPLLPVATAFVFSFFHGGLTHYFWEMVGVTAKNAPMPEPVAQKVLDQAEGSED
jgi:hypothetical protein